MPVQTSPTPKYLQLLTAIACWLAFALTAWWAMSGRSLAFDTAGLEIWRASPGQHTIGPGWLTGFMRAMSFIGSGPVRIACAVCALAFLLYRRQGRPALLLGATALSAALVNMGLKPIFSRPRPDIVHHLGEATGLSFPSGHAFNSAAIAMAIALALTASARSGPNRRTAVTIALLLAATVAFSRVWLGVHYPTDVIAGLFGGMGWVLTVQVLARASTGRRRAGQET